VLAMAFPSKRPSGLQGLRIRHRGRFGSTESPRTPTRSLSSLLRSTSSPGLFRPCGIRRFFTVILAGKVPSSKAPWCSQVGIVPEYGLTPPFFSLGPPPHKHFFFKPKHQGWRSSFFVPVGVEVDTQGELLFSFWENAPFPWSFSTALHAHVTPSPQASNGGFAKNGAGGRSTSMADMRDPSP